MMKKIVTTILLPSLLFSGTAFALGGDGATCNPSTVSWGSCELAPVPFISSVTNSAIIPSGNYSSPFEATQANTYYTLQGDIVANGTAIIVKASNIVIDLNGHTITYNQTVPGEGITIGAWNKGNISIRNGSIIQGAAMSEGQVYGLGNSPVGTYNTIAGGSITAAGLHVANLYVRYGGRDVGGVVIDGTGGLFEQLTTEDLYEFGTLKNRSAGTAAITGSASGTRYSNNIYRNNTIIAARHRGIRTGDNSETYGNRIELRSIASNAAGVYEYQGTGNSIHDNTIVGRGEHPIGVFLGGGSGANDYKIYNNDIDVETTALGDEYGASYTANPTATYEGNSASGIRATWGADSIQAYNNKIVVRTNARYTGTYSPTGATAYIDGGGKGMFVGAESGESSSYVHNSISVTGDGSYNAGIAISFSFAEGIYIISNTITSSLHGIVVGDDYGPCNHYPLIMNNTIIQEGSRTGATAIANLYNSNTEPITYHDGEYKDSTARIINNVDSIGNVITTASLLPALSGTTDMYFGTRYGMAYSYYKRLHDNNNTSSTVVETIYDPAVTLDHVSPTTCTEWSALCSSLIDCSNNWPGATWNEETGCNAAGIVHPNRRLSFGGGLLRIVEHEP